MKLELKRFKFWKKKPEARPTTEVKKEEEEFPEITSAEREKYVGKHVAILDGKIVAAAKTATQAITTAKKKNPKEKIVLKYIANKKLLLNCKCLK